MIEITRRFALAIPLMGLMTDSVQAANELTVADVEKISGLTGVALVAIDAVPGARGNLNFVRADRKLLLIVNISDAKDYVVAKQQFGKGTLVAGIGDEAFTPDGIDWVLYGRKGGRFFGLGSGLDPVSGNSILSPAQLQQIGKLVAGRI